MPRRVRVSQCKYLNNIVESSITEWSWLPKGYGSLQITWRRFAGHRSRPHDSKGQSKAAGQKRCSHSGTLQRRTVWHRLIDFKSRSTQHGSDAGSCELAIPPDGGSAFMPACPKLEPILQG